MTFHHVDLRDWTQVFRVGSKCLYLLSHQSRNPLPSLVIIDVLNVLCSAFEYTGNSVGFFPRSGDVSSEAVCAIGIVKKTVWLVQWWACFACCFMSERSVKGLSPSSGAIWAWCKSAKNKRRFEALPQTHRCIQLAELWATGKIRARGFLKPLPAIEACLVNGGYLHILGACRLKAQTKVLVWALLSQLGCLACFSDHGAWRR